MNVQSKIKVSGSPCLYFWNRGQEYLITQIIRNLILHQTLLILQIIVGNQNVLK